MPERDAAAVRVGPVRRKAELCGDGERLGGERLVHLEQVDVIQLEVGPLQELTHRGYRPDAHHPRLDTGVSVGEIKADIAYFKRSYERADLQVTIAGLDPEASAAAVDARLGGT